MHAHHHATPGEAEEFCDLYKRYRLRLVRYCRQRLRGMGDPEDAAHEALLRALQAWSRLDRSVDAWPWLATIAARVCTDMRRRSARAATEIGDEPISDVHDLAVARLRASIIDDALDRLPVRYRNPLILKEYAGWSYRDIARLEGASVASVRSNIMRGRRYLGARVESVARSQGQWPLPAVVPRLTARLRHRARTWRHALHRVLDPTMVVTGLALVIHPGVAGGAAFAMAAALGAAPSIPDDAAKPAASYTALPHTARPEEHATVLADLVEPPATPVELEPVPVTARETLTRIDKQPVQSSYLWTRTSVAVQTSDPAMWLEADIHYGAPVIGEGRRSAGSNIPCGEQENRTQREACRQASDALRPLPD